MDKTPFVSPLGGEWVEGRQLGGRCRDAGERQWCEEREVMFWKLDLRPRRCGHRGLRGCGGLAATALGTMVHV